MKENDKNEISYLFELLSDASRRNTEEGEDALRIEIDARITRILNAEPDDDEIPVDNPVDENLTGADYQALEAQHLNDYIEKKRNKNRANDKWKKDKVRVRNTNTGKWEWHQRSECHQEKRFPDNQDSDSFKWVWDGPAGHVDKLGDELWTAHEQGEE